MPLVEALTRNLDLFRILFAAFVAASSVYNHSGPGGTRPPNEGCADQYQSCTSMVSQDDRPFGICDTGGYGWEMHLGGAMAGPAADPSESPRVDALSNLFHCIGDAQDATRDSTQLFTSSMVSESSQLSTSSIGPLTNLITTLLKSMENNLGHGFETLHLRYTSKLRTGNLVVDSITTIIIILALSTGYFIKRSKTSLYLDYTIHIVSSNARSLWLRILCEITLHRIRICDSIPDVVRKTSPVVRRVWSYLAMAFGYDFVSDAAPLSIFDHGDERVESEDKNTASDIQTADPLITGDEIPPIGRIASEVAITPPADADQTNFLDILSSKAAFPAVNEGLDLNTTEGPLLSSSKNETEKTLPLAKNLSSSTKANALDAAPSLIDGAVPEAFKKLGVITVVNDKLESNESSKKIQLVIPIPPAPATVDYEGEKTLSSPVHGCWKLIGTQCLPDLPSDEHLPEAVVVDCKDMSNESVMPGLNSRCDSVDADNTGQTALEKLRTAAVPAMSADQYILSQLPVFDKRFQQENITEGEPRRLSKTMRKELQKGTFRLDDEKYTREQREVLQEVSRLLQEERLKRLAMLERQRLDREEILRQEKIQRREDFRQSCENLERIQDRIEQMDREILRLQKKVPVLHKEAVKPQSKTLRQGEQDRKLEERVQVMLAKHLKGLERSRLNKERLLHTVQSPHQEEAPEQAHPSSNSNGDPPASDVSQSAPSANVIVQWTPPVLIAEEEAANEEKQQEGLERRGVNNEEQERLAEKRCRLTKEPSKVQKRIANEQRKLGKEEKACVAEKQFQVALEQSKLKEASDRKKLTDKEWAWIAEERRREALERRKLNEAFQQNKLSEKERSRIVEERRQEILEQIQIGLKFAGYTPPLVTPMRS